MSTLNVDDLELHKETLKALQNNDISQLTPVQQAILKSAQDRQNFVVKARQGDDKHVAFAAAACEILQDSDRQETVVLMITDSSDSAQSIAQKTGAFYHGDAACICIDEDGHAQKQAEQLKESPAVVVATPARLQQLLQEHHVIFRSVDFLVLDELDRMLQHEQAGNLKRIKRRLMSDYTGCICSETYDTKTKQTVAVFVDEPVIRGFEEAEDQAAGPPPAVAGHLKQGYMNVPYRMKISTLLAHVQETESSGACVIFTASKRGTDRLYKALKKQGKKATSLHAKLSDEKHAHRFSNFTKGNVQYLLVSDISAADLHMKGIHHIINYDVPNSSDEYRYRAALLDGADTAQIVSLVSKQDRSDITELQNELGQTPDKMPLPKQVQQKVKQRKQKKGGRGKKRSQRNQKKRNGLHLPEPNYDKLSGGRSGNHDKKKSGVVKFFKKLFS